MDELARRVDALKTLTRREMEVLKLTCSGMTQHDVKDALVISVRTVKFHQSNIYDKLELSRLQTGRRQRELGHYCETLLLMEAEAPSSQVQVPIDEQEERLPQPSDWGLAAVEEDNKEREKLRREEERRRQALVPSGPTAPQAWQPGVAPPPVQPGAVLYAGDWSSGANGWPSFGGWKALSGMLLNDGTGDGNWATPSINLAQHPDYAVEADIQIVDAGRPRFGIVVRDGYRAGYMSSCGLQAFIGVMDKSGSTRFFDGGKRLAEKILNPGGGFHLYRVEVSGNTLRFLIGGALVLEASDNRYWAAARWASGRTTPKSPCAASGSLSSNRTRRP